MNAEKLNKDGLNKIPKYKQQTIFSFERGREERLKRKEQKMRP